MNAQLQRVKYWEIIADNLSKNGWSYGCVSAIDSNGRTIWIADAHSGDGKRFVVHADEKLTAFVERESARSALPANWFDRLARFFKTRQFVKRILNQAEDTVPRWVLRLLRTRQSQNQLSGGKRKEEP